MFLQPEPIPDGSANPYDYCNQDPINCYDLKGQWGIHWKKIFKTVVKVASSRGAAQAIIGSLAVVAVCGGSGGVLCGVAVVIGYTLATRFANQVVDHPNQSIAKDARRAAWSGGEAGAKSGVQKVYVNLWREAFAFLKNAR